MGSQKMHTDSKVIEISLLQPFKWDSLLCKASSFKIEWNEYLNGFILTFADGKQAQTQINIEQNRLHTDFGESYLERYTEYDDELTGEQHDLVDAFVDLANEIKFSQ